MVKTTNQNIFLWIHNYTNAMYIYCIVLQPHPSIEILSVQTRIYGKNRNKNEIYIYIVIYTYIYIVYCMYIYIYVLYS